MKKITYLIIAVIVSIGMCLSVSATEIIIESETETVIEETLPEETQSEISSEIPHTLLTRLWEYVNEHKSDLIGILGDVAIFVLALLIKARSDKIRASATSTNQSQTEVVGAVNKMIDGYNALKTSYDTYGLTENDRNRVIGALVAQNTAILETLVTMCANNKNTPQGVKDLVMLKYANCLKMLDDDEQLKAIVTAVRDNIGVANSVEQIEDEVEESEV